jgi:hypothetical protein
MEFVMTETEITEIIDAYTKALIDTKHIVGKLSELPYEKPVIEEALLLAYKESSEQEEKEILEEAILKLESFLDDADFSIVSEYLTQLGELRESEEEPEKIFELAAQSIPTTAQEVLEIFNKIENNLKASKEKLGSI